MPNPGELHSERLRDFFFECNLDPSIAKELDSVLAPEKYGHWEFAK